MFKYIKIIFRTVKEVTQPSHFHSPCPCRVSLSVEQLNALQCIWMGLPVHCAFILPTNIINGNHCIEHYNFGIFDIECSHAKRANNAKEKAALDDKTPNVGTRNGKQTGIHNHIKSNCSNIFIPSRIFSFARPIMAAIERFGKKGGHLFICVVCVHVGGKKKNDFVELYTWPCVHSMLCLFNMCLWYGVRWNFCCQCFSCCFFLFCWPDFLLAQSAHLKYDNGSTLFVITSTVFILLWPSATKNAFCDDKISVSSWV